MAQPERKEQRSEEAIDDDSFVESLKKDLREKEEGEVRASVLEKAAEVSERYRPALDRLAE